MSNESRSTTATVSSASASPRANARVTAGRVAPPAIWGPDDAESLATPPQVKRGAADDVYTRAAKCATTAAHQRRDLAQWITITFDGW